MWWISHTSRKKKWRQMVDKYRNVKSKWQSREGSIREAVILEKNANRFLESKCGRLGAPDSYRSRRGCTLAHIVPKHIPFIFLLPLAVCHSTCKAVPCFQRVVYPYSTLLSSPLWYAELNRAAEQHNQLYLCFSTQIPAPIYIEQVRSSVSVTLFTVYQTLST